MSDAPASSHSQDAGDAARRFFVVKKLLGSLKPVRFYTGLLINPSTTIIAVRERQNLSKSTSYKYSNILAELEIAEERDEYQDGSALATFTRRGKVLYSSCKKF